MKYLNPPRPKLSPQTYRTRRYDPKDGRYAAALLLIAAIALSLLILMCFSGCASTPTTQAPAVSTVGIQTQIAKIDASTLSAQQKARELRKLLEIDKDLLQSIP